MDREWLGLASPGVWEGQGGQARSPEHTGGQASHHMPRPRCARLRRRTLRGSLAKSPRPKRGDTSGSKPRARLPGGAPAPTSCRPHRARHCPEPCRPRAPAPGRPTPRPRRSPRDLYKGAPAARWSGAAAALPAARPPAARASDAGVAAVSAFAMRPRAPGPTLATALGGPGVGRRLRGLHGFGDPAPGEWGGRKGGGRGGPPTWACQECGPGDRSGGAAAVAAGGRER